MPIFEINGGDGVYEVNAPDEMTAANAFKQMQGGKPQQPTAPGMMATIDSGVRQIAKGVPFIGNYLDEANAATNAALHPVLGTGSPGSTYGERYNANVQQERAKDKAFETQNPIASTALQVGGGLASGGAALRAAPAAANLAFGNIGASVLPRIAGGFGAGAVMGGVGGFGEGETLPERGNNAMMGAGVGGIVGGAAAPVIHGATSAINWLRNRVAATQAGASMGLPERPSAGAVQRVARNVEADNLTPASAQQRAAELGPEGMVMDLGRQLQGRAEAVATMPGTAQNKVLDAVEQRVKGTADRIGQELDTELGKSPNIVDLSKRIDDVYNSQIRPAYKQAMDNHPQVWDATLEKLTRRGSINKAIDDAVSLAREHGDDIVSPFIRNADGTLAPKPGVTPNLAFWDYVKKSLDSRIGALARNPDPDSAGKVSLSALLDTKRALVNHLDTLTNGTYAKARNIAADKFAVQEALDTGLGIFQNKMLPEQFQELVSGMGVVEKAALKAGARRALERMKEVSPANMSEGGRQVYRELLQGGPSGDTGQKLKLLLGDSAAERLANAAQRETTFQSAHDKVAANSRTAVRGQLVQDMQTPQVPDLSIVGAVNRLPLMPVERGIQSMLTNGSERTRQGVADILTAQGQNADPVVNALLRYVNRRQLTPPGGAVALGLPSAVEQTRRAYGQ